MVGHQACPSQGLLAKIAVSKHAGGLPLYRQEAIYAGDKIEFGGSLMAGWMGLIGFDLEPDPALHRGRYTQLHR